MRSNNPFINSLSLFLMISFSYLNTGCNFFFQDPRQILYRPATIKIEDSLGQVFSKLPLPVSPHSPSKGEKLNSFPETDPLWGKDPSQTGLTEPFSEEEIPYLGGDNCLNSVFFDFLGIPYSKDSAPVYQSKMFYGELQGFVKEPANYFFYKNHLFLKESTYPYLNKDHQLMIGDKIFTEGSNPAIDQFYLSRLNEYKSLFKEKTISLKISCQYEARTMGGVKEDILLQMFESDQSFIFLASKEIHMMTRKDRMLHYVSDFMFSKAFFLDLQFKAN